MVRWDYCLLSWLYQPPFITDISGPVLFGAPFFIASAVLVLMEAGSVSVILPFVCDSLYPAGLKSPRLKIKARLQLMNMLRYEIKLSHPPPSSSSSPSSS